MCGPWSLLDLGWETTWRQAPSARTSLQCGQQASRRAEIRRPGCGYPYVQSAWTGGQSAHVSDRPRRRRPRRVSRQGAAAARGRRLRGDRRGRRRRRPRSPRRAGCGPRSSCSTSSFPTCDGFDVAARITEDDGGARRRADLEPRLVGLGRADPAQRRARLPAQGPALRAARWRSCSREVAAPRADRARPRRASRPGVVVPGDRDRQRSRSTRSRSAASIFTPLIGWSFIGTGLFAWWRRPDNSFGAADDRGRVRLVPRRR